MSDSESPPSFSSVEEECAYWKEQYASKRQEATELEDELEEFQVLTARLCMSKPLSDSRLLRQPRAK